MQKLAAVLFCVFNFSPMQALATEAELQYQNFPYYDSVLSNESIGSVVSTPYHLLYHHLDTRNEADSENSQISDRAKRLAKMVFLELPLIHQAKFYQHEFGHGFRARDFGKSVDYQFGLPYPYRFFIKNHETTPGRTIVRGNLQNYEGSVVTIGGLESELVLSQLLLDNAAVSGAIDRPVLNLYFFLKTSTLLYGGSKENEWDSDVKSASWAKDVKSKALISLLDPVLLFAVVTNVDYLMSGHYSRDLPWVSVGNSFRFIPSLSYYLIPYGESYEAQVLATFGDNILRANFADWRFVNAIDKNDNGTRGGFMRLRLLREIPSLMITPNVDVSVSQQPYFESGSWYKTSTVWFVKSGLQYKFDNAISLTASVGRKNKGYLPHTSINEGTIYSAGLGFPAF
jgi:hypothetical protein